MKLSAIILSFIFFLSCEQNAQNGDGVTGSGEVKVDKQIPTNGKGISTYYYTLTRQFCEAMNLDPLEQGFDSLQIRIWLGCHFGMQRRLIVLKFREGNRRAILYQFLPISNNDATRVASFNKMPIEPKSGWNRFSDSLSHLKVKEFPDMATVLGMEMTALDYSVEFFLEIATPTMYRFCTYNNLKFYRDKNVWPASNMANFIRLLSNEFDFPCSEVQDSQPSALR